MVTSHSNLFPFISLFHKNLGRENSSFLLWCLSHQICVHFSHAKSTNLGSGTREAETSVCDSKWDRPGFKPWLALPLLMRWACASSRSQFTYLWLGDNTLLVRLWHVMLNIVSPFDEYLKWESFHELIYSKEKKNHHFSSSLLVPRSFKVDYSHSSFSWP